MHGLHENFEAIAPQIERLAGYLYGQPRPDNSVDLAEIIRALPELEAPTVERLLGKLDSSEIVEFDDRRQRITLVPYGRLLQELQCVPEVVLGLNYSDQKFAKAVVRIVIQKPDGEPGAGTGFFVAEPPDRVITNRHVAENQIVQIEDSRNQVILRGDSPKILGPDDLDLAAITCQMPADITPVQIDWKHESVRHRDRVLVFGYPYVANHEPALLHAEGTVLMITRRLGAVPRNSLIISNAAARGCSGGPVIGITGMAVGIVAREEQAEVEGVAPLQFLSAIPSHYLRELLPK